MNNTVAYLGPEGTFSHLVARKRFSTKTEFQACESLAATFEFVLTEPGALAVVPIENSSGGTIYDTIDLLIKHADEIQVFEDLALDVRLALLGHHGGQVRTVYSHFVPLHHHREWLMKKFPKARIQAVSSTAVAAKKAASSKTAVALAAPGAAALYGLDVLRFPIRPEAVNVTRFYVIGRRMRAGVEDRGLRTDYRGKSTTRISQSAPAKTSLIFALRNECGSLYAFLGALAKNGVNLRMIVSRPMPGFPDCYVFFVEIDGAEGDPAVACALKKAKKCCDRLTLLGSYPTRKRFAS